MGKEKLNSYQRLKLMLKELQHDYDVLKKMKEIYQEAIEDIADPSLTVFAVAKAKGEILGQGTGHSKKIAEANAAKMALENLASRFTC